MTTSTVEPPSAAACAVPVTHHRTTRIDGRIDGVIDTGHFALEDEADEIMPLIRDFLSRKVAPQ